VRRRVGAWGCLVVWSLGVIAWSAPRAEAAEARDVVVRTSLDRTAIWVADRITYAIALTCRRGVDLVVDDLARDKLRLDGLEILGADSERAADRDESTTYRFRYYLTTYGVDVPELTIAPVTVRYSVKRPGQRLEDAVPAGEVQIPGAVVAFRSVLPDGQETYDLRVSRGSSPRPMRYALLQPIGLGLVLISIVPAALATSLIVGRARRRRVRRSARQVRHDERASLDAVESIDITTPDGRRDVYARLNALVRDHLRDVVGIGAPSLTPAEIGPALSAAGARVPIELVTAVLSACELARYAPAEALPSREACREAIEQSEQVLASGRGHRERPPQPDRIST
jgi:hypothetical protein